jgi:hypothetical protein
MRMKYKVISIKQPWAYLICSGIKDIENRTWKCQQKYIGERVLIHASAAKMKSLQMMLTLEERAIVDKKLGYEYDRDNVFAKSVIIGSVEIVDCVLNHPSIWAEKTMFDYGSICYKNECEHFKEWSFGHGDCESCELVGQSYFVDTIPDDCLFKKQMPKPIYNWVLADPILFDKPILNVKGKLGFWDYELPDEYETILKL